MFRSVGEREPSWPNSADGCGYLADNQELREDRLVRVSTAFPRLWINLPLQ